MAVCTHRKDTYQLLGKEVANPYKVDFVFARLVYLIFIPVVNFAYAGLITMDSQLPFLFKLTGNCMFLWMIPAIYFSCCDPLPPAKVKQWQENRKRAKEKKRALKEAKGALPVPS